MPRSGHFSDSQKFSAHAPFRRACRTIGFPRCASKSGAKKLSALAGVERPCCEDKWESGDVVPLRLGGGAVCHARCDRSAIRCLECAWTGSAV